MSRAVSKSGLKGCHVVSLRPVGGHAAMRRAAAREGARVIALSPWRIVERDDDATRKALQAALRASRVVFTSPSAVRAAARLGALQARAGRQWLAVGAGTARALQRAGIDAVAAPTRMDSEGLLALPQLRAIRGTAVGLVTAPGGRARIAPALGRRGARVLRADVYERVAIAPAPAAVARLLAARGGLWLALSSGEALALTLSTLPDAARRRLLQAHVLAASERLAGVARRVGFADVVVAASAQPRDLLAAARQPS